MAAEAVKKDEAARAKPRRRGPAAPGAKRAGQADQEGATTALRIAAGMGLLDGPKVKHLNAKVQPKLFQAAADKLGTTSPAAVVSAALAALATEDELGPWLARRWGALADADPELLDQIDL